MGVFDEDLSNLGALGQAVTLPQTRTPQDMLMRHLQNMDPQSGDEALQELMQTMRTPLDSSGKWFQAAGALMSPTKTGGFGESLSNGLGAYGKALEAEDILNTKRGDTAAKVKLDSTDALKYLSRLGKTGSLSGGLVQLPNGNTALKAGDRFYEVIPDKGSPEGYRLKEIVSGGKTTVGADTVVNAVEKRLLKELEGKDFSEYPDPGAAQQAWTTLRQHEIRKEIEGNARKSPITTTPPNPVVTGKQTDQTFPRLDTPSLDRNALALRLQELSSAMDARDKAKTPEDRSNANADISSLRKDIKTSFGFDPFTQDPPDAPKMDTRHTSIPQTMSGIPPNKDVLTEAAKKAYGEEQGKTLMKEYTNIRNAGESASRFSSTMALLGDILDQGGNIASGPMAEKFNQAKSMLQSLGFKVDTATGMEDIFRAFSTESALKFRTAGGENLLPGAMSNYEDQLLRSIMPNMPASIMGRRALVDLMQEVAKTNLRFMEEANKMAGSNKHGMLPPEWNQRSQRVMLEEKARLRYSTNRILQKYGGKEKLK